MAATAPSTRANGLPIATAELAETGVTVAVAGLLVVALVGLSVAVERVEFL